MNTWKSEDLKTIVTADDMHIAPLRTDGKSYGTPTWIWCVAVDGDLYVRAYHGQNSRWYGAAVSQNKGRIIAAGKTEQVRFETVDADLCDSIDAAYRAKYAGSPYLDSMISARARWATIRIIPDKG